MLKLYSELYTVFQSYIQLINLFKILYDAAEIRRKKKLGLVATSNLNHDELMMSMARAIYNKR